MSGRVITFGEVMLRLKSPNAERLLQSPILEATFGGGEANVAVSLANFGVEVAFVTTLPENPIGDACVQFLRGKGVDTTFITRGNGRMGIYFLESGANQRPSMVIYDRENSSLSSMSPGSIDWASIFSNARWFHITGITPALTLQTAELALEALKIAKEKGLTISCDYNFRKNLWKYGKPPSEVMSNLIRYVDIGIANEEDCQQCLGIQTNSVGWETAVSNHHLRNDYYKDLCEQVLKAYPNLIVQFITLRESINANNNAWSSCFHNGKKFCISQRYEIPNIIDRVGAGDAFAAGVIYGFLSKMEVEDILYFATAASCLKHSIPGDFNTVSVDEVEQLIKGDTSGRVKR